MTDVEVLKELEIFIEKNVADKVKLEKPPEKAIYNQSGNYELVSPSVYKGWLPLKNLDEYEYSIPSIVVMMDDGIDDTEDSNLNIRLKIVTYDPGETQEDGTIKYNGKGYMDLLNLMTKIRLELSQNPVIAEKISIKKPIKWSMDSQQSYPYWTANMSFAVFIAPLPFNTEKYFNYL